MQQQLFDKTPLIHKAEWMPVPEQAQLKDSAARQEAKILAYFTLHDREAFTACEVWKATESGEPVTSTRRAITNLVAQGKLQKLPIRKRGIYGHSAHLHRLARP